MGHIIFSADISSPTCLEHPDENEPPHEISAESFVICFLFGCVLDSRWNPCSDYAGKALGKALNRKTLNAAGEQRHRAVGLVDPNEKPKLVVDSMPRAAPARCGRGRMNRTWT